jgi:hypothetical protein
MIDQFLTYELKVAVLIAVFYIFWRLLVANETWHRLNRIVLIATAIASFVLPLCVITVHQTVEVMPPAEIPMVVEDLNSVTHESGISNSLQRAWFDLQGRRLTGKPTEKGIYINNCK